MAKRLLLVVTVCGLAAFASGCCCGPCGDPCGMPGPFGYSCNTPCGIDCEPGCGSCGSECGDACGDSCCDPCGTSCAPCGPLTLVLRLINRGTWCGDGCGEKYWCAWHNDPPCPDPCDCQGNYVGRGCNGGCATGNCATEARQGSSYVKNQPQTDLPKGAQIVSETDRKVSAGGPVLAAHQSNSRR